MAFYSIEKDTSGQPTGNYSLVAGSTNFSEMPISAIIPFGGTTIPTGFLLCNGAEVSKTEYADLYAVIGDSFKGAKADPASGNFYLPDLREVTLKGVGANYAYAINDHGTINDVGGFMEDRVQEHTHAAKASATPGNNGSSTAILMGNTDTSTGVNTGRKGSTTEVKAVGVNYIIKAKMVGVPADFMAKVDEVVESANSYSTTEQLTGGKWIDGKPIYRKVVEKNVSLTGNTWNSTGVDVSEIDTLCNCVMLNSKFAFGGFYTKKVSNQLDVYCVSDANWGVHTFILEYTKTTD